MAGEGGFLSKAGKLVPALGWLANRLRHPALHCGIQVELPPPDRLFVGTGVRIGAFSRIYLGEQARLTLGDSVGLGRDVHIQSETGHIRIGEGTGVNDRARLYGSVSIGRYGAIGPNLMAGSTGHVFASPEPWRLIYEQEAAYPPEDRPIVIEDDCWIGINVVIQPGVTIGRGAVIGANSIVMRDVAPYTVVAGAPARVIRERLAFMPPAEIVATKPEDGPYFYSGFAHRRLDRARGMPFDRTFVLALQGVGSTLDLEVDAAAGTRFALQAEDARVDGGRVLLPLPKTRGPFLTMSATAAGWLRSARITD